MSIRQRLESLEQTLQPGRFLVLRLDLARDSDEQLEAFRAENGVTARDTLVTLLSFSPQRSFRKQKGNRHDLQFPHTS
jgi:uncharacterized SAM-dependent methyltransferase